MILSLRALNWSARLVALMAPGRGEGAWTARAMTGSVSLSMLISLASAGLLSAFWLCCLWLRGCPAGWRFLLTRASSMLRRPGPYWAYLCRQYSLDVLAFGWRDRRRFVPPVWRLGCTPARGVVALERGRRGSLGQAGSLRKGLWHASPGTGWCPT